MKKKLFTLFIPLLFGLSNAVQAQVSFANDGAVLELASDTISLGEMTKDNFYNGELAFSNTGNQPLIISNAKGSCGCTVPEWPREPIMPGESKIIKIRFHARSVGQVRKQVTITSNASNGTNMIVVVAGNVQDLKPGTAPETKPTLAPRVKAQ